MITIRNNVVSKIPGDSSQKATYTWVDARDINRDDIARLEEEFAVDSELLADIMDPDEASRIEKEDDYTFLIVRLPAKDNDEDNEGITQYSIPTGIVLYENMLITICQTDSQVLEDFSKRRFRQYPVETKEGFVLSLLGRSAMVYIRMLKVINRQRSIVEETLSGVVMNKELLELQEIQKSLVYFKTSLTSNEMLLEKLQKSTYFKLHNEDEEDFLDDTIIDTKQAISMATIYSDLLTGTMEVFGSIINNNMNMIMKRLTIISIALMFPTFITSFYGMNVPLPFQTEVRAWWLLGIVCILSAVIGSLFLTDKRDNRTIRRLNSLDSPKKKERKSTFKSWFRPRKKEKI